MEKVKSKHALSRQLRADNFCHNHFQLAYRVSNLTILPSNIAIPTSLINENENGQLHIVFYVQIEEGFLLGDQLEMAVQVILDCIIKCVFLTITN